MATTFWVLACLGLIHLLRRTRRTAAPVRRAVVPRSPFQATSIIPCEQACMAAWALEGQRTLLRDKPKLPLSDCDCKTCHCRFADHKDRRTPGDRRSRLSGLDSELRGSFPKRKRGRRATDR